MLHIVSLQHPCSNSTIASVEFYRSCQQLTTRTGRFGNDGSTPPLRQTIWSLTIYHSLLLSYFPLLSSPSQLFSRCCTSCISSVYFPFVSPGNPPFSAFLWHWYKQEDKCQRIQRGNVRIKCLRPQFHQHTFMQQVPHLPTLASTDTCSST